MIRANALPIFAWRMPWVWYRRLTLATAGAIWMLIVLGGLVRVTDSGTGCGDSWPMCNGHLFPALEYHQMIEWTHRLFATLVGFLMIVTIGSTVLWYRRPRRLLWLALLAAFTYLLQAVLGGITVLLHLDHKWVAAHMGNSMILMASTILLALFAYIGTPNIRKDSTWLRWVSLGTLIWTFVAMFTGSLVVGAGADVACPAWPQCGETYLLPGTGDQWINFGHRIAVGFSDVLMVLLALAIWRTRRHDWRLMNSTHILSVLYVSQVFLGAFTIWLNAPGALKGAHLALAAATWSALAVMTTLIWVTSPVPADTSSATGGQDSGYPRRKARRSFLPETVQNYITLTKPRVIVLLLVPTAVSMLIAAVRQPPAQPLLLLIFLTLLGGTLASGGAHAINQYIDRDIDARMRRTKRRPVVTGRVPPRNALIYGILLSLLAFVQLWTTVNLVAAILAIAGNLFYVFIYTLWLKRSTTQNIVIGGAAGAVPPLVGWAAVTGGVGLPAILFFAIIFFWTPAHFWALALVRQEDYREAGIPMLPVVSGEATTRVNILLYAILLLLVTLLPFTVQALSWIYLIAAIALGVIFIVRAGVLMRNHSVASAWGLFKYSNYYLALLYLAMVVDRLLV